MVLQNYSEFPINSSTIIQQFTISLSILRLFFLCFPKPFYSILEADLLLPKVLCFDALDHVMIGAFPEDIKFYHL